MEKRATVKPPKVNRLPKTRKRQHRIIELGWRRELAGEDGSKAALLKAPKSMALDLRVPKSEEIGWERSGRRGMDWLRCCVSFLWFWRGRWPGRRTSAQPYQSHFVWPVSNPIYKISRCFRMCLSLRIFQM